MGLIGRLGWESTDQSVHVPRNCELRTKNCEQHYSGPSTNGPKALSINTFHLPSGCLRNTVVATKVRELASEFAFAVRMV
jgi:hypothetical protein